MKEVEELDREGSLITISPVTESELPFLSKPAQELTSLQTIQIVKSNDNCSPAAKRSKIHYLGVIYTLLSVVCLSLNSVILRMYRHIHPFNLGTWSFPISALVTSPLVVHAVWIKKEPVLNHIWPIHKNKKTVFFMWVGLSIFWPY